MTACPTHSFSSLSYESEMHTYWYASHLTANARDETFFRRRLVYSFLKLQNYGTIIPEGCVSLSIGVYVHTLCVHGTS